MPPSRRNPAPSVNLDDLFGLKTVSYGDARLQIRRMLSRKQRRQLQFLELSIQEQRKAVREMIDTASAAEVAGNPPDQAVLQQQMYDVEDVICDLMVQAVRQLVITEGPWEELDIGSLSNLYSKVADAMADAEDEAVRATGVPTNEDSGSSNS